MAKTLTEQIHGSVGPTTYQGSRHGTIRRARVKPVNPRSLYQTNQRAILTTTTRGWRKLSNETRLAWSARAAQLPGKLTGFNVYTQLNARLLTCGLARLDNPPEVPDFGLLQTTGLVVDTAPTIKLTQVQATVAPDKFLLEAARPISQGRATSSVDFRLIAVLDGHAAPAADLNLTAPYLARFGPPSLGERVTVRLSAMKNGFKSAAWEYTALCAAPAAPQMAAPAGEAWNLAHNGNDAVATYVGQPPAGANWQAQFRALGDPAWLETDADALNTPLAQPFNPWPQGGIEARVRYTDAQARPLSDWSAAKPLA